MHLLRRADHAAVVEEGVVPHSDDTPAGPHPFPGNPVGARQIPPLGLHPLAGPPDLHAVEPGHIVLVHSADRQVQITPGPFCRDLHLAAEPDDSVEIDPQLRPGTGQFRPLPVGIIVFRGEPSLRHAPLREWRQQLSQPPHNRGLPDFSQPQILLGKGIPVFGATHI